MQKLWKNRMYTVYNNLNFAKSGSKRVIQVLPKRRLAQFSPLPRRLTQTWTILLQEKLFSVHL